jgi:DNA-binding response OmpR family regulator
VNDIRTARAASDASLRPVVYLVEDHTELREELVSGLSELGFDVIGFGDAPEFYRAFGARRCDVAVLDVGLPQEDGFSIAARLHAMSEAGIVMLTARSSLEDRIRGLQGGADAYVVKPVDLRELAAIIHSVFRRVRGRTQRPPPWRVSEDGWTLYSPEGRFLPLTEAERCVVGQLMASLGECVTRQTMMAALADDPGQYDPHRLDALISRLRRKAAEAGLTLPLRAVRGIGYVFSASAQEPAAGAPRVSKG